MKVVAITGPRACALVDRPDPTVRGNFVRVRIHAAPMCTEFHAYRDGCETDSLGHEAAGDVLIMAGAGSHPILQGIPASFRVRSWLYHVLPLPERCKPLLWGVPVAPECPPQGNPVAWTSEHRGGRVFTTTMGHPEDFGVEAFTTLLTNGICWAVGDT